MCSCMCVFMQQWGCATSHRKKTHENITTASLSLSLPLSLPLHFSPFSLAPSPHFFFFLKVQGQSNRVENKSGGGGHVLLFAPDQTVLKFFCSVTLGQIILMKCWSRCVSDCLIIILRHVRLCKQRHVSNLLIPLCHSHVFAFTSIRKWR